MTERALALAWVDARVKTEACQRDFNENRPHTSLCFMTPVELALSVVVNPERYLLKAHSGSLA